MLDSDNSRRLLGSYGAGCSWTACGQYVWKIRSSSPISYRVCCYLMKFMFIVHQLHFVTKIPVIPIDVIVDAAYEYEHIKANHTIPIPLLY